METTYFYVAAGSGPVREQTQPGTLLHQINHAVAVESPHDVAAMDLDRPARAVELQGHFIGRAALEHEVRHLLFYLRQRALYQPVMVGRLPEGGINRRDQKPSLRRPICRIEAAPW